MPRQYKSGVVRAALRWTDTDERYMNLLLAVKDHFTGFTKRAGFDPSRPEKLKPAQRAQIRKYYNTLTEYTEGAQVYKMTPAELPREMKQARNGVEAAKRAAQMRAGRKRSKFIFVKFDGETIPRFEVRNGAPVIINNKLGYAKETIELNQRRLAENPVETVLAVKELVKDAKLFRIMAGPHEFFKAGTITSVAREVEKNQMKYDVKGNHNWRNWLFGITAYYSDNLTIPQIMNHQSATLEKFRENDKKSGTDLSFIKNTKTRTDFDARIIAENEKVKQSRKRK